MHRMTAIALWLVAAPALADSPIDKWTGSIGEVALEGQVDVPLYGTPWGSPNPCVKVHIGENAYIFGLSTSSTGIYVTENVAKKEEFKIRHGNAKTINLQGKDSKWKTGGEIPWSDVDEIRIGELVLSGVRVRAEDPEANDTEFFTNRPAGWSLDGILGLGALPEDIVWAVRPSTGVVSFARGASADDLRKSVEGTTLDYRVIASDSYKYGKRKGIRSAKNLVVTTSIGGETVDAVLTSSLLGSSLASEIEVPDTLMYKRADRVWRYLPVSLGGVDLGRSWFYHTSSYTHGQVEFDAVVGMNHLSGVDLLVDPVAKKVTLATTDGHGRHDPLPFILEEALKAVAPAPAEEAEAGTEESDNDDAESAEEGAEAEDAKPPGDSTAWGRLADIYQEMGNYEEAITARKSATAFNPRSCPEWQRLGKTQLEAGQIGDAIVSLETASTHYHAWYDVSLEEREKLQKKLKKLEGEEKQEAEHYVAASSCHTADGYLAAALFSAGDMDTIESLYRDRLDLDPRLAMATANARMVKGDFTGASEPLRQAVKLRRSPWASARVGLALTYAKAGDWGTADGHYKRAMNVSNDHRIVQMWLEGIRSAQGADASISAALAHVRDNPERAGAYYGLLMEAKASGDEESIAGAQAMGDAFFAQELQIRPRSASIWSTYARYLVQLGRMDQAKEAAVLALQFDPGTAAAWLAMSDVEQAAGNTERADMMRIRAAQVSPFHPGYALMMKR